MHDVRCGDDGRGDGGRAQECRAETDTADVEQVSKLAACSPDEHHM